MKFTIIDMGEYSLTIAPQNIQDVGQYLVYITLDDSYANPFTSSFKVIIDDPLSSKNTKEGKGLKEEIVYNTTKKRTEVSQASIRIKEVTRDGRFS